MIIAGHNRFRACQLVPIRVGMILRLKPKEPVNYTCPHTRGDDPVAGIQMTEAKNLSPYAWG